MILGIIGGMGPLATCDLFQKIIEYTDAETDKDHLHIIIDNNTQIPDRTEYIMGLGEDPRAELIKSAKRLEAMEVDYIAIACNTAHYFYDDIEKHTNVKIIHMIEETARFLNVNKGERPDYLLLSTKGTYKSGIYQKAFKKLGLNIIEPDEEDKNIIMKWIYNAKSSKFNISRHDYDLMIHKYIKNINPTIVLGCTELPILAKIIGLKEEEYINPTLVLAKYCVDLAKEEKTKERI